MNVTSWKPRIAHYTCIGIFLGAVTVTRTSAQSGIRIELSKNVRSRASQFISERADSGGHIRIHEQWLPVIPAADVRYKGQSFTIALLDVNNNGKFNDVLIDYIVVGRTDIDRLFIQESVQSRPLQPRTTLHIAPWTFALTRVDSLGRFIDIRPGAEATPTVSLLQSIPDLALKKSDGSVVNLRALARPEKYLYVCFCDRKSYAAHDLPLVLAKALDEYDSMLEIVMLCDQQGMAAGHHALPGSQQHRWTTCLFDRTAQEALLQNGLPYGVLFAPDGKLVDFDVHPFNLARTLRKATDPDFRKRTPVDSL